MGAGLAVAIDSGVLCSWLIWGSDPTGGVAVGDAAGTDNTGARVGDGVALQATRSSPSIAATKVWRFTGTPAKQEATGWDNR